MRRWGARLLCGLLCGLLSALGPLAAQAQPIVVHDDLGQALRLERPAQRIVSLLPSITESVAALGAGSRLVGVDRYSNWPPEVAALPRLGGIDDAQIEAIVRLKPDVVLASSGARSLERLEALGVPVLRLKSDSHADVRRSLALLAQLLGRPTEGERVWAGIEAQLAAAQARVPTALRGRSVYFELGGGPYAAGAGSFIGQTLARLGLANAVPPELGPFPKLNPEHVVRARPEIVMGALREQAALRARPGWQAVPALREGRLCGFDEAGYELLIRPGPRLGEGAALIADCLQRLGAGGAR